MDRQSVTKMIIGGLEICQLPELGIRDLQVRVDTGAKTSSLHVDNLTHFKKQGKPWVAFDIHPDVHNVRSIIHCEARIHDIRNVKSSNGESQERYVIKTQLRLGNDAWPIEITLADRSDMSYLMLLGREGMSNRVLVDPSETFVLSSDD